MKRTINILVILISLNSSGQTKELIDKEIAKVKSVPTYYFKVYNPKDKIANKFTGTAYLRIKQLDTVATPYLISKLTDSTITNIDNPCLHTKFKIADIAFFLINYIEPIPLRNGYQCSMVYMGGECGSLPDGFLYFINAQRQQFQNSYVHFYYGEGRRKWLRLKKK